MIGKDLKGSSRGLICGRFGYLEYMSKITTIMCQNSQLSGRDWDRALPEYMYKAVPLR